MRHFTALLFLLCATLVHAQDWMPIKFGTKHMFLKPYKLHASVTKLAGVRDSVGFTLHTLNFNEKAGNRYRSNGYWGTAELPFYGNSGPYHLTDEGIVRHANFWCKFIDSAGIRLWTVATLYGDTLAFSTEWPRRSTNTITKYGRQYSIYYPLAKRDTAYDGVADSVLVYSVLSKRGPNLKLVLSKKNGLLQWDDVRLWTNDLQPKRAKQTFQNYLIPFNNGGTIQYYNESHWGLGLNFRNLEAATISNSTFNGQRRTYTTTVESVSLGYRYDVLNDSTVQTYTATVVDTIAPLPWTVLVPDTVVMLDTALGNTIYKTMMFRDTTLPWMHWDFILPARVHNSFYSPSSADKFADILDRWVEGDIWLEGLGKIRDNFGSTFGHYGHIDMTCINTTSIVSGQCLTVSQILSVEKHAASIKLKLYPNPATTSIRLETDAPLPASYSIHDAMGREVKQGLYESGSIMIENLPSGLYRLRMAGTSSTFVKE